MDGHTVRDWLAAVNDGVPGRHAPSDRFRDPERCGQPSDPNRHAGPWGGVLVFWLLLQTFVKKPGISWDRRPTAVGVVRTEDGSTTMSVDGRGWSLPVSTLLHSSELQY